MKHPRDARYEFIRAVAMVLVIGVHSLANVPKETNGEVLAGHILSTLFLLCNGLFFMISGRFSLRVNCQTAADYKTYYLKRFGSIGIPVLVGMVFRSMYNIGWWPDYFLSFAFVKEYLANVFFRFSDCEYWFLYDLVGYLIAAPFLGKMLQKASRTELTVLVGICVIYNALKTYLPVLGFSFAWKFPLDGWLVFLSSGMLWRRSL